MIKSKLITCVVLMLSLGCLSACGSSSDSDGDVTVSETAVSGITISSSDGTNSIEVGQTLQLTATVYPSTASQEVTWSSADTSIATVSETGLVTGVLEGNVNIMATSVADTSISQSFAVIVEKATEEEVAPESITVTSEGGVTTLEVGATLTLTAVISPSEANQSFVWSSSDTSIATVQSGKVTGVAEGSVTITVAAREDTSITASIDLTVEGNSGGDYANMEYTTHEEYMAMDNDTAVKVYGVVTYVTPVSSSNTVNYFIQNGTEGFYVYNQDYSLYPVEEGKTYEVGGQKAYYRGLHEIDTVTYFNELETSATYEVIDVNGLDVSSTSEMEPYHNAYVSATGTITDVSGANTSSSYSVYVDVGDYSTIIYVDKNYMSDDEFQAIYAAFAACVAGSEIEFKGYMTQYGYSTSSLKVEILVVRASDITADELTAEQKVSAVADTISAPSSVDVDVTSIDLPTTSSLYSGVSIAWESDSSAIDASTGAVTHAESDTIVNLTATITCGTASTSVSFSTNVFGTNNSFTTLVTLDLEDAEEANSYGCSTTKPNYAGAEVTLGGHVWYLDNALIANSSSDHFDGTFSIRAKASSSETYRGIEITEAGEYDVVQFDACTYGSHATGAKLGVKYSTDGGTTWTDSGSVSTLDSYTLTTYRVHLPAGEKIVSIYYIYGSSSSTVNIDNIYLMN